MLIFLFIYCIIIMMSVGDKSDAIYFSPDNK